jgi:hypothetical protein
MKSGLKWMRVEGVKRKYLKVMLIVMLVSFLSACAALRPQPDPTNPIRSVAILPMTNNTNDVEGPNFVRKTLAEHLGKYKFYRVKPIEEVDQLLRDRMGVTLGGQLDSAKVEDLKKLLGVEGLIYGTLMDYGQITTGLINERKVSAKFRMINTIDSSLFWENGLGVKSQETTGGDWGGLASLASNVKDIKKDHSVRWIVLKKEQSNNSVFEGLVKGLAEKAVAKTFKIYLKRETRELVRRVTFNLRQGPGL